jgi:hypothetical protein
VRWASMIMRVRSPPKHTCYRIQWPAPRSAHIIAFAGVGTRRMGCVGCFSSVACPSGLFAPSARGSGGERKGNGVVRGAFAVATIAPDQAASIEGSRLAAVAPQRSLPRTCRCLRVETVRAGNAALPVWQARIVIPTPIAHWIARTARSTAALWQDRPTGVPQPWRPDPGQDRAGGMGLSVIGRLFYRSHGVEREADRGTHRMPCC